MAMAMAHDDDGLVPSLTGQLRALHQRLDPKAPRYMANGQRKAAITALLGGIGDATSASGGSEDGGGSGGEGKGTDDRRPAGSPRARPAAARRQAPGRSGNSRPRREAGGVKLPAGPAASKPQQQQTPGRNIDRLGKLLFGDRWS